MATSEQEGSERQQLATILTALQQIEVDGLIRTDVLGRSLDFAPGRPAFQRMLRLFRNLQDANLEEIPFNRLQQLNSAAKQALTYFQAVQNFSVDGQPNPSAARDGLVSQVRDNYDNIFDLVSPVIAYSTQRGTNFESLENEARTRVIELNGTITS
jgi:hypothetical protein